MKWKLSKWEDRCDCGRNLAGESARARDISRSGVTKVRNEVTLLGGDLAWIGELDTVDVRQHHRETVEDCPPGVRSREMQ